MWARPIGPASMDRFQMYQDRAVRSIWSGGNGMKKRAEEEKQKNPVSQAVRDLRVALGESQQAFAYRMKTAIRTIARYETVRAPKGKALAEFQKLANETGHPKIASVFAEAYMAELGPAKTM